jgi:hypothetical protein
MLADLVMAVHFAFVVFVVLGGIPVVVWPRLAWFHVPAVLWGIAIELSGQVCPLTPLENWLRGRAAGGGYGVGFVEHYIGPILYPTGLTRATQFLLAAFVLLVNAVVYGWVWKRRRKARQSE